MHIGMLRAFRLIKTIATGEDNIGRLKQILFKLWEFRRREFESRQFIHAVVDRESSIEMLRNGQHHWRVKPTHQIARLAHQSLIQQSPQKAGSRFTLYSDW